MKQNPEHFIPFKAIVDIDLIPHQFTLMMEDKPHPLCLLAVEQLQDYLRTQNEWEHNFGLADEQENPVIGKMFGVLVVGTTNKEIGYLAAFSGKLSYSNIFSLFVPPIFDTLKENGFLSLGMKELSLMSSAINTLKELKPIGFEKQVQTLQKERKSYSNKLQNQLFENYHFLNQIKEEKSLIAIFKDAGYKNPPAGAGECAAPKLLQYAFQNKLKPLALTEFWWGQSPKSATWKHQHFYLPCKEKCEPILAHMLKMTI